jgi:pyrroline-5-carboxylate reductase
MAEQSVERLLLVGGGKMGAALLTGWLEGGLAVANVAVVEPDAANAAKLGAQGLVVVGDVSGLPGDFMPHIIVFAVKPQVMNAVAPLYKYLAAGGAVVLSIAAGVPIARFESHLGAVPVVRSMPNTPAAIGRGMTVACANKLVTDTQKAACGTLLEAVGEVAWIDDEAHMDAVTAVSGSGPAYVFLMIECLAAAGEAAGLEPALAAQLAGATVGGAGDLALQASEDPAQLRINVTSPAGTTEAALKILMADDGLAQLMSRAVEAAANRSRELAKG